jgi:hypothetical protein
MWREIPCLMKALTKKELSDIFNTGLPQGTELLLTGTEIVVALRDDSSDITRQKYKGSVHVRGKDGLWFRSENGSLDARIKPGMLREVVRPSYAATENFEFEGTEKIGNLRYIVYMNANKAFY